MNRVKRLLIALASFAAVSISHAASVHVVFDNWIFNGSGYDDVSIQFANATGGGRTTEYVLAGRFQGTGSNVQGVPESIFVDGLSDLYMYCYDLYESVNHGQSVDYAVNLGGELARTLDFLGAVNDVMNQGKSDYDKYAWLHPVDGNQGAAIQLGIWESKYETDTTTGWSLDAGAFKAQDLDAATKTWWNSFSAATPASQSLDGAYVMTLEASGVQDMITGDPPAVPEPATIALFGLALAGAAAVRKRSR